MALVCSQGSSTLALSRGAPGFHAHFRRGVMQVAYCRVLRTSTRCGVDHAKRDDESPEISR
jgi:hypothetical protein